MRTTHTNKKFAEAMMLLAKKKEIEKITVQDLLDTCNASRQTFYNHFQDKNDLINWIYADKADEALRLYRSGAPLLICVQRIYAMFTEYREFFTKAIRLDGQNSFLQGLFDHSREYYIQQISQLYGETCLTKDVLYAIDFNCFGAVNMTRQWMLNGMQETADEMALLLMHTMPQELKRFFPDLEKVV